MPENIITETLNSNYEEGKFTRFIDNLLYEADFEKAQQISPLPSEFKDFIKSVKRICKYEYEVPEYGGSKVIDVLTVKLKRTSSIERARTAQRNFVARYLNGGRGYPKDAALVAFISEDENGNVSPDWRFSFVQMSYETKLPEKPGEQLKTRQEITPAKRFSFLVGANEHTHTAQRQLKMLFDKTEKKQKITTEDISAAFDIEIVSIEFFDKYKELFIKLKDELQRLCDSDEKIRRDFSKHKINIEDFAKKTLGQLVFLYFIQKKGWLGVKPGGKWGSGDRKFLRNVFERKYCDYHNFFNDVLEHLFYEALATDRTAENDLFKMHDCRIPFLNGGLFEPVNGYDWRQTNLTIDNRIFRDIFDVFDLYNFTVKEDEPLEKEVAIDPEMLGKVFENLLPENLRKGNGAYYTPREIVHYMCQQSLINYLYGRINKAKEIVSKDDLEIFVKRGSSVYENRTIKVRFDLPQSIINNASIIDNALAEIKICDPAIGSGAFPVGMMNEIVRAREALNAHIGQPERSTYSLKRNAIENCLYGVDLDGGAVEIAKLRLWLSLVVDEENINEIKPLPNLDYKIMQGNSLISTYEGIDFDDILSEKNEQIDFLSINSDGIRSEMQKKLKNFFNTVGETEKRKIKQEITQLFTNYLIAVCSEKAKYNTKDKEQEYKEKIEKIAKGEDIRNFFPWKLFFADIFAQGGFDVVIGNPPYIKEYENKSAFDGFRENSPYYKSKMDLWYGFTCHGMDLLCKNGILCFIAQNNWTTSTGAKILRNKIISEGKIKQLLDFNTYMVFDADIQTMVMMFEKNSTDDNYFFDYRKILSDNKKEDMLALLAKNTDNKNTQYLTPIITRKDYKNKLLTFSENENILEKIAKGKKHLLGNEVAQGIVPNPDVINKKNIKLLDNKDISVGEGVFVVDKQKFLEVGSAERKYIKPLYEPYQMKPYYLDSMNDKCLLYITKNNWKNDAPTLLNHLKQFKNIMAERRENKNGRLDYMHLHWPREEKFFISSPKILAVRKCVDRPIFVYYEPEAYVMLSVNVIMTKRWNMKFLTGLFNSKLIAFWLKNKGKMQGNNYQIDKEPLLNIPIPSATQEQQAPIIALVDKILAAKKENPQADTSDMEKQIDQLVYALYGLTEEEIRIVEQG